MEASQNKQKILKFVKLYLPLFVVVSFVLTIVIVMSGFNTIEKERTNIEEEELKLLESAESILDEKINDVYIDLLYFSDAIIDTNLDDPSKINELAKDWNYYSSRSTMYSGIRFVDNDGKEVINVDFNELTGAHIVGNDDLKNIKDQEYYINCMALPKKTFYISSIELEIKNGEVVEPNRPIIVFGYQVYDEKENKLGSMYIDYKAESAIKEIVDYTSVTKGEFYIIDEDSYWIANSDESKLWGNFYSDRNNVNFANQFPAEWYIITNNMNQVVLNNGLFIYKKSTLNSLNKLYNNYDIKASVRKVIFVSYIPITKENYILKTNKIDLFIDLIIDNSIIYAFTAIVLFITVLLLPKKYSFKKDEEFYSKHDPMTNVLNRKYGYLVLTKAIEDIRAKQGKGSIWYYDVNGVREINEQLGEKEGDNLIIKVSEIIKNNINNENDIIRYAGDEFIVFFRDIDMKESKLIWTKILKEFDEFNKKESEKYKISVSIGMTDLLENITLQELVDASREKMEENKKSLKKKK